MTTERFSSGPSGLLAGLAEAGYNRGKPARFFFIDSIPHFFNNQTDSKPVRESLFVRLHICCRRC